MPPFTILHVSDLHWSKAKANDQRIVVDALFADLRVIAGDGIVPDIILFTGDLVQAGDDPESFKSVEDHFLSRLRSFANGAPLIVVPGNHDIQREVVRAGGGFVQSGLKSQLASVDAGNSIIDALASGNPGTAAAVERMGNFDRAYPTFGCAVTLSETPLLKTYKLDVHGMLVGIAAFNTAWRATGEGDSVDRHFLLLGERNVDVAAEALSDCQFRIAAFHHPLDWLADFDTVAVASRLQSEFDLLAFGHSHLSRPEMRITSAGSAVLSQAGCLYEHRDYFNGYQLVTFRPDDGEVDFHIRTYFNRPRRMFDKAVDIAAEGKMTLPYRGRAFERNEPVESFLRETRAVVRQAAIDQVNIVEALNDLRLDPKDAFICPPLTVHRAKGFSQNDGNQAEDEISPDEILRSKDNFLIVGSRESGKSTLAHYLAVLAAEGAADRPRIPAIIDFRQLKLTSYGIGRSIATYYGAAKQGLDVEQRLEAGDFILIVDNYSGRDRLAHQAMNDLVGKYAECRWILLADSKPGAELVQEQSEDMLSGFRPVHIQALPRKSIRRLSKRWSDQAGIDDEKTFAAVMVQLREANLPRTGYMVTLLLWALYQEREFERLNEAVLLTYVIDHLLGKADFSQALKRNFDPTSKEITLQHLASVLRMHAGILPKNDVVAALIAFFKMKGLQYDASEVLRQLIDCGLLKDSDGLVSFKYRCFGEYFYANLLRNDVESLNAALTDRKFVEYGREIELLSGLRRQNKDVLDVLRREIEGGIPVELKRFDAENFDAVAREESQVDINRRRLADIKKKKLTADQVDDLMDAADREAAKREQKDKEAEAQAPSDHAELTGDAAEQDPALPAKTNPMKPEQFVASVSLLGRVVRNSEFTDAADKLMAARVHLKSSIQTMLLYADIIKDLLEELTKAGERPAIMSQEDAKGARYIIRKWFVIVYSVAITEEVGTEKLFSIFEELFDDAATTRVERLLIAMALMDLNHPKWLAYWDIVIGEAAQDRFTLDILMDRLYHLIHTRALTEQERRRVEAAAEKIENTFGIPQREITASIEQIRAMAKKSTAEG